MKKQKKHVTKDYFSIETPDKIIIEYKTASPFVRLGAFIIDTIIFYLILIAVVVFLYLAQFITYFNNLFKDSIQEGVIFFFLFIIYFVLRWGFFVFFEALFNGKTPGKHLLKLRVINYQGKFLDIKSIVLRNFTRIIDEDITFYLGAFFAMMSNNEFRRIGDLIGNTVVIKEESLTKKLPDFNIKVEKTQLETDYKDIIITKKLNENELYILRQFLNSYETFSKQKQEELGRKMAISIKNKVKDNEEIVDPILYLKNVYLRHQNEH
ncbi:MAG: hypothetical protein A2086_07100 [Spirochaetes bacterium GWD1_27_9]|nr:MAG: hypothetical protein A2Y34_03645 [Spirochaetes bacterium GWC1_27_15]OHD35765.1 MAG: hypothetical protein A2086_07100 [Spirochaetes bacterium GWD1_27_9]